MVLKKVDKLYLFLITYFIQAEDIARERVSKSTKVTFVGLFKLKFETHRVVEFATSILFLVLITARDSVDSAIPTNRLQFGTKTDTFFHARPRFVAFRKFSSSCRAASRREYRENREWKRRGSADSRAAQWRLDKNWHGFIMQPGY